MGGAALIPLLKKTTKKFVFKLPSAPRECSHEHLTIESKLKIIMIASCFTECIMQ